MLAPPLTRAGRAPWSGKRRYGATSAQPHLHARSPGGVTQQRRRAERGRRCNPCNPPRAPAQVAAAARAAAGGVARPWCARLRVALAAAGPHAASLRVAPQIRFILLQNRQGRTRLAKYYVPLDDSEKRKLEFDIHRLVVNRDPKFTNFLEARPARGARLGAKTHAESFRCSARPRAAHAPRRERTRPPSYRSCALHRRAESAHEFTPALRGKAVGVQP